MSTRLNGTNEEMIIMVSKMLNREVKHFIDMTDKLNSCKYGKMSISIESEKEFKGSIEGIKRSIISISQKLISYKQYAENNK